MDIPIIFEDENLLLINKPYGLLVHGDGKSDDETVANWFLSAYPESAGVGEVATAADGTPLERSGIVHRLDRETSGVMVLAKNDTAFTYIKKQFQDRSVRKEYHAFVYGAIKDKYGTINRPIGRHGKDPRQRSAQKSARGVLREAITDFECVDTALFQDEVFSYVKLFPQTGRTHQLRAHLRAVDRPIVGDTLYAGYKYDANKDGSRRSNHLECDRLMLHAHSLTFTQMTGEQVTYAAELPDSFTAAQNRLVA